MWKDPIVEEIRKHREEYASAHAHDIEAIFQDVLQRQEKEPGKYISRAPRKPVTAPDVA